jgi:hypothetical protein
VFSLDHRVQIGSRIYCHSRRLVGFLPPGVMQFEREADRSHVSSTEVMNPTPQYRCVVVNETFQIEVLIPLALEYDHRGEVTQHMAE